MVYSQETHEPKNVMTVTGTAQIFASPDEAIVRLGVTQNAGTAQDAQSQANAVIQKLLTSLKSLGIPKENIQTSRMSLSPIYTQARPGETPRIASYQANDLLSIRVSDFSLVGKIVDAGTSAGINDVEGIDFELRNAREPRAKAYKEAVADARSKADAVAEALGVKIIGIYDVQTDGGVIAPQPRMMGMAKMGGAPTPVEPGQVEVNVTVTIRYQIG